MTSFKISGVESLRSVASVFILFVFICLFVIYLATHFLSIADYIASKEVLCVTDAL
jgi:hypothetical protein